MTDDCNSSPDTDRLAGSPDAQSVDGQTGKFQVSEQHFQAVIETMALAGLVVDSDGRIVFCNDYLLNLTGWQRHEVVGSRWLGLLIPPEDRQALGDLWQGAIAEGQFPTRHETDILTRSGGRCRIAWNNTILTSADGRMQRLTSIGQDITTQRQADRQPQVSESHLQRVVANLSGVLLRYVQHPSGSDDITYVSPGCTEIWDLEPAQLQGHPQQLWQTMHPDDRSTVQGLLQQSGMTLTPWFCEWRLRAPSRRQTWLQGIGCPERLDSGAIAWDIVVIDASARGRFDAEHKQTEQALTRANQQIQAFIDNAPALVSIFDSTGHYRQVNQATADQFGLHPHDLVRRSFADLLPPSVFNRFMERVQHIVATQAPLTVEDTLSLGGEQRVFRSVLFPVSREADGTTILGSVATDITPLARAQAALRRRAEEERLIRTITQHIHQSLEVDQILQTTVTEVRQFLQTDRVLIYRFNADLTGTMVVEAVLPPWQVTLGLTIEDTCFLTRPELVDRYRQGRTHCVNDLAEATIDPCYRELLASFQVQANLVVPINCGSDLWGLLCVHHCRSPRLWQPKERALVAQLANQVAIALQQSQLLAQTATLAQQEKLLNNIIGAIGDSLELKTLLQRAATEMLHTFQASRGLVILCQATDAFLVHTNAASVPGISSLQGQTIPIEGNPHAQRVLAEDLPVVVDDVGLEPTLVPNLPLARELSIGAILAVSIRYRGVVKGILSLHQCPGPRRWSEAEIKLIKRLADHLAIAIHQAELYAQAQLELAERKRLEAQLRYDASHDRLTGLPNRTLFLERLSEALDQLHQHCENHAPLALPAPNQRPDLCCDNQFALLFLDLDRFKVINDSLGHAIGDRLLQVVAQRLQTCLRPVDVAARLGGDEFVVLLANLSDAAVAVTMAQRIHAILESPVLLERHEVFIHASIGIALSDTTYTDPNQVLRDADIAMYKAKGSNREYAIFDAPMHTLVMQQMELENELRRALERFELRLYYQPIINLVTGAIQGFEALVRWQNPRRGLVSPLDFIPIAENTGLITTLDLWTLNEACRQLSCWQHEHPSSHALTVSVNLSGKQFVRPDLIQQIDAALGCNGLEGKHLKVEITESVLIQNAQMAIDLLQQLRQRRIAICMDDFGTGYSSLSYLHRFPIDVLKIDKSFITNLHRSGPSTGDYEIVKAIISLATNLNLTVVAEGIETAEQAVYLQTHQCQAGQGYYFSRPLSVADATAFIAQLPQPSPAKTETACRKSTEPTA
ncbi:EAL domain-containing protein [Leptolyngbya sp. CCNP1308]|uniref:bifunctional diguanylate cyclase/phosphodiesterase n=1 Tax=Leptolyngbya sp. CCNP1308 TaxID=3110255 RepID=UPI002B218CB0|nr:EAL domain-containing protein [Leptolyngbya sp. CCNP1308]MEA5449058.1 EAL domain-containing protein [Leptolyngbya sp. CCNP1308]